MEDRMTMQNLYYSLWETEAIFSVKRIYGMGYIVLNFNRLGIYSDPYSDMGLRLNLSYKKVYYLENFMNFLDGF